MEKSKKQKKDPFHRIKYAAYCLVKGADDFGYADLVRHAQFQLCVLNHTLLNDPIWKTYSDEHILMEWYAHRFDKDEEYLKEFERKLDREYSDDDLEWFNKQIKQNQKEIKEKTKDFEFTPIGLGE